MTLLAVFLKTGRGYQINSRTMSQTLFRRNITGLPIQTRVEAAPSKIKFGRLKAAFVMVGGVSFGSYLATKFVSLLETFDVYPDIVDEDEF